MRMTDRQFADHLKAIRKATGAATDEEVWRRTYLADTEDFTAAERREALGIIKEPPHDHLELPDDPAPDAVPTWHLPHL